MEADGDAAVDGGVDHQQTDAAAGGGGDGDQTTTNLWSFEIFSVSRVA